MRYLIRPLALVFICFQTLVGQETADPIPVDHPSGFRTWHLPEGAIARLGKGSMIGGDHTLDISSDGRYLAVGTHIGLWTYEVATNRLVALLPTESVVYSVSFSSDGATLAAGLFNGSIGLWQAATGRRIGTLQGGFHGERLSFPRAIFSPDGATLASGSYDGTVQLWDMATRKTIALLKGHTSP